MLPNSCGAGGGPGGATLCMVSLPSTPSCISLSMRDTHTHEGGTGERSLMCVLMLCYNVLRPNATFSFWIRVTRFCREDRHNLVTRMLTCPQRGYLRASGILAFEAFGYLIPHSPGLFTPHLLPAYGHLPAAWRRCCHPMGPTHILLTS